MQDRPTDYEVAAPLTSETSVQAGPPAWVVPARLTVVTGDGAVPAAVQAAADALAVDVACATLASFDHGRDGVVSDALWVTLDRDPGADMLVTLKQRVDSDAMSLVLHVSNDAIDPVWAVFGNSDGTAIVINPDEAECTAALALAVRPYRGTLSNALTDQSRDHQIDRLQEEVQRISALLSRLSLDGAGHGGAIADGSRPPPSPFIEDHVAAAPRSFRPQPGGLATGGGARAPTSVDLAARVRVVIRHRRMREQLFAAELFADPAWDMMLDLFAARLEGRRVSVSSLCIAAAVPATTALRWIRTLTETGLFVRDEDPHDRRRIFVALSAPAAEKMHRYFESTDQR